MEKNKIIKGIKQHKGDIKYKKYTIVLVKLNNCENLKINYNNGITSELY